MQRCQKIKIFNVVRREYVKLLCASASYVSRPGLSASKHQRGLAAVRTGLARLTHHSAARPISNKTHDLRYSQIYVTDCTT